MGDSQYLDFDLERDTGKTQVWAVLSRSSGAQLATVKWYGAWRQYTFWPEPGTIWNRDCLHEVDAFIARLMAERSGRKEGDE